MGAQPTAVTDPSGLCWDRFTDYICGVVLDVESDVRDAYRERGGGIDGFWSAVDEGNPVARFQRSARQIYTQHGGGLGGAAAVVDWAVGIHDAIALGRACFAGDAAACAATTFSALATLCGTPVAGRLATKVGSKAIKAGAKADGAPSTALVPKPSIARHAAIRMAKRGITAKQVAVALRQGTRYYDRKNGTFSHVLESGFASGRSLVVATNVFTGRVVTVINPKRFNPDVLLPGGRARYVPAPR